MQIPSGGGGGEGRGALTLVLPKNTAAVPGSRPGRLWAASGFFCAPPDIPVATLWPCCSVGAAEPPGAPSPHPQLPSLFPSVLLGARGGSQHLIRGGAGGTRRGLRRCGHGSARLHRTGSLAPELPRLGPRGRGRASPRAPHSIFSFSLPPLPPQ